MPTLYNIQTKEPEQLDGQALQKALLDGTHSYEQGTSIPGYDLDEKPVTIPSKSVRAALTQGYTVQTPTQAAVEQAVKDFDAKNPGIKGAAIVAGTSAVNQLAMGLPELIYNHEADPLSVAKTQAIAKEHGVAEIGGGAVGVLGSLFVGGPLFQGAAKAGEATAAAARLIAAKIGVTAAEEIGPRAITAMGRELATNIAAKGLGGTVEGALIMAPHAATEAVLGEPSNAAESLMAGGAIGGVLGGGGQVVKGLFDLSRGALRRGAEAAGATVPTLEAGARKLATSVTGVPEQDIISMVEHHERLAASPPPELEAIKDMMDSHVAQRLDRMELAKENFVKAQNEADQAYGFARQDLANARAPVEVARDLQAALEHEKSVLGDMSLQADQALVQSGAVFQKKDLLGFIDKVSSSVGAGENRALIGDEAVNAINKINTMRTRVEQGLTDEIDATTMRDVLRQVRSDINYNQSAGEFNDTLNKLKKNFTNGISDILKDKSPEYANIMTQMQERSKVLQDMSKAFGTPEKALGSLNKIVTPAGELKSELLGQFGALTKRDYLGELENLRNAKNLLGESRVRDIRDKLIPETVAKAKDLEQKYLEAKANVDEIKRLSPNRTQSIISNQGFKNASIEDRRALEILGKGGTDFNQMIKDRNLIDSFQKARPMGSKHTNLGAVIGGALGYGVGGSAGAAIGGAIGGTAGAALDPYGGKMLKALIEKNPDISGLLFVEKQMKRTADKLDEIPGILKKLTGKLPIVTPQGLAIGTLGRLVTKDYAPNPKNSQLARKEKVEHLKKINQFMTDLIGYPAGAAEKFAGLSHPISSLGAPNIGGAFSQKLAVASQYLYSQMPKPPAPISPFAPPREYQPSDADLHAFEQKAAVVHDPWQVLTELEHGTLTKNHMDALQAVYPYIASRIQQKVQESIVDGVEPVPYAQRLKLSLLMGAPMDKSVEPGSVQYLQTSFAQNPTGMDEKNGFKVDLAKNFTTEAQRVSQETA